MAKQSVVRVLLLGDNTTRDPIYRRAIDRYLRTEVHHVEFIGDLGLDAMTGGIIGSDDLTSWGHSGMNSNTVAQVRDRIPGIVSSLYAEPDIVVLGAGTWDVSAQRSLEDILADISATISDMRTAWPHAHIILNSIPTVRSGSSSGANWAEDLALRDAVVAGLPDVAKAFGMVSYVNGYAGQPAQEIGSDGFMPNEDGYRRPAMRIADEILRLVGVTRRHRRPLVPHTRPAQSAIVLSDPSTASVLFPASELVMPSSGNFAVHAMVRFTDTTAGVFGVFGASDASSYATGWGVVRRDAGISFYMGSDGNIWPGNVGYAADDLQAGVDYHIAIVCDRESNRCGYALNGKTIYHSVDLAATGHPTADWDISTPQQFWIGRRINNAANCTIKMIAIYRGANAPRIYDLNRFAEQTYVDGVYWDDAMSALFRLDNGSGNPTEAAGAIGAGTLSGAAAWGSW